MTGNLFPARLRTTHIEKHHNMTYRRNGKLQACEPCRKGKLRCDHMMPNCGRCVKRGKTEKCIYHPAPLTKPATKRSLNPDPGSFSMEGDDASHWLISGTKPASEAYLNHLERTNRSKSFTPLPRSVRSEGNYAVATSMRTQSHRPDSPLSPQILEEDPKPVLNQIVGTDALEFDKGAAFINHSAVLAENESIVGLSPPGWTGGSRILQSHIDRGVRVLVLLKDLSSIQKYIDKWFSFAGGVVIIEPMVKIYLEGLWSTWHKILESSKAADLQAMSAQIWENTSKPLSRLLKRDTTPREFCSSVTGPDLRWEVIGILASLVSLVAQSLKDGDPVFCSHDAAPVHRVSLAASMHNVSEECTNFCDTLGVLNDLYLWLLYENSVAYCSLRTRGSEPSQAMLFAIFNSNSLLTSPAGYDNWKKTSALAAALQCANLHQEITADEHTPFFIAELRKRLFICAYNNDKTSAVSAGRPPKLTRLYCRLQIPLDLTDAQTMSEGAELQATIAELDEEGWNQEGAVQRSTFARISATNALITEEILEISLGYLIPEEIVRRAADIEARVLKSWDDLPEFLRIDFSDPWNSHRSPLELLFLVVIRLASLDHQFLLQRTLSKKVHCDLTNINLQLLSVCAEIFRMVVMLVDSKDYFRDFQIDFVQILAVHGIPAAAVLAMELLHQEQNPTSVLAQAFPLHRSDTIQSLSVFVSCLGTIRPDANGYQSCDRGRAFLKRILDLILGPGPALSRSGQAEAEQLADPTLGAPLFEPGDDGDFMRWLDDVTWDQETWINLTS